MGLLPFGITLPIGNPQFLISKGNEYPVGDGMPGHLHADFQLNDGDIVHVTIDHQANVMLLDDSNYRNYQSGGQFRYHGGHYKVSPINIAAPSTGHWHVVIDLGGHSGTIRHSINIIKKS